jgi:Holliday junction DNA helicase RuvA
MIGRLSGRLLEKQAPDLLLDVNGVGYELQAPMTTFYRLPPVDAPVCLYTHLVVREDAHLLYGFIDDRERQLFRALIKVNGVGPKLALAILSGIDTKEFVALVRLPGVGRKTAERLLVEMRDRLKDWAGPDLAGEIDAPPGATAAQSAMVRDACSAMEALGYKPAEAARAVQLVLREGIESSEQLIRLALKAMVK